jgi:hypothetical protein
MRGQRRLLEKLLNDLRDEYFFIESTDVCSRNHGSAKKREWCKTNVERQLAKSDEHLKTL